MTLNSDIQRMVELVTTIATNHTRIDPAGNRFLDRIHLSKEGHPQAAAWDNGPRSALVWCDLHQQDVRMCHQETWGCTGVPLNHPNDPTGDAAMRCDRAADDERMYRDNVGRILRALAAMADTQARYPAARKPNAYERQLTATENDPRCESCARIEIAKGIPWWVEPRTKERTTIGGRLEQPMWCCDWCENHVIQTGLIPSEDEVEQHRAGKRVRCPHPKIQEDVA